MNIKHFLLMIGAGVAMAGCVARQDSSADDMAAVQGHSADVQRQEAKALEGTWRTVSVAMASGEPVKEARATIAFVGHKMIMKSPTGTTETFSYRIDALAKPKILELTDEQNTNAPPKFAIYELEGDSLRVSFGVEGMHPKAFDADERPVFLFERE